MTDQSHSSSPDPANQRRSQRQAMAFREGPAPSGSGRLRSPPGLASAAARRLEYVDPRDGARPEQLGLYITKLQAGFELTHQLDASRAAVQGLCAVMRPGLRRWRHSETSLCSVRLAAVGAASAQAGGQVGGRVPMSIVPVPARADDVGSGCS